jgi:hypothetical protein
VKVIGIFLFAILAFGCIGLGAQDQGASAGRVGAPSFSPPEKAALGGDEQYIAKAGYIVIKVPEGTLEGRFEELRERLRSEGAEISNINYNEYGERKQYIMTIKVLPAKFDSINEMVKESGEVKDLSVQLEDVTTQYVELDLRIKNRQVELERLYELYNKSKDVSELLEVEREIARVETDLELLKQQKEQLQGRVDKSIITITVYEDKPATTQLSLSLESLGAMFFGAVAAAITLIVLAAGFLAPLAIVIGLLWFVYKKLGQRKAGPKLPEHKKIPPPD